MLHYKSQFINVFFFFCGFVVPGAPEGSTGRLNFVVVFGEARDLDYENFRLNTWLFQIMWTLYQYISHSPVRNMLNPQWLKNCNIYTVYQSMEFWVLYTDRFQFQAANLNKTRRWSLDNHTVHTARQIPTGTSNSRCLCQRVRFGG